MVISHFHSVWYLKSPSSGAQSPLPSEPGPCVCVRGAACCGCVRVCVCVLRLNRPEVWRWAETREPLWSSPSAETHRASIGLGTRTRPRRKHHGNDYLHAFYRRIPAVRGAGQVSRCYITLL